ncbi:hypothetical protein HID58_077152, partial [Brassica napus]
HCRLQVTDDVVSDSNYVTSVIDNYWVTARIFTYKSSHCTNATEVRLLRFREARNVKKGRELIDQLRALANTNRQLPGALITIHTGRSAYITVVISIFDALALAFYNKLESYATEPTIVLATSINPKIVGGQLTGEGTYETTSSSKVVYAQKEALIVSELKQYVIAADPQALLKMLEDEEVPDAQLPGVNALASNGAADENSNVAPHHPCLLIQLPKVNHQPNSNLIRARVDPRRHAWHKFT